MRNLLLFIIISLIAGSSWPQTPRKDFLSKEAEYQQLSRNIDYWINSPIIMDDSIIFFFKESANKVLLAGDFNGWKAELLMEQKNTNFFQISWDSRLSKGVYRYKYVVDDIWINDPYNTNTIIDESGQPVSFFELKDDFIPYARYPLWFEKDYYIFKYENTTAKNVFLVGDFNNWNPFNLVMTNKGAGKFNIKIRLKPGIHSYCFVVDGEWKTDPNNRHQYSDEVGNIINTLYVSDNKNK